MHTGTIKELHKQLSLENIDLTLQEFYFLVNLMEKTGFANLISKQLNEKAGRQSKIYQIKSNFNVNLNLK
jgi:hypothetical protein